MTPFKLINQILHIKDRLSICESLMLFGSIGIARFIETDTGISSFWWYYLTFGICMIINFIFRKLHNFKIRSNLMERIQQENDEIATVIVDHGVINPSQIKPLLESISEKNDE